MKTSETQKVAVIGSGVVGLNLAFVFKKAGFDVCVISSVRKQTASWASHGVVSHKGYVNPRDELFALKLEGAELLLAQVKYLEKRLARKIPHQEGVFEVFRTQEEDFLLRKRIYHRQFTGCFRSELLEGKVLLNKAPFVKFFLDQKPFRALNYPFDFSVDSWAYLEALKELLLQEGVTFKEGEIKSIKKTSRGLCLLEKERKHTFDHALCAVGASGLSLLSNSGFDLDPFFLSSGLTLRLKPKNTLPSGCYILSKKNYSSFGDLFVLGSLSSSFLSSPSPDFFLEGYKKLLSFLPETFKEKHSSYQVCSGVRVYTKERSPLLRSFDLGNGSKVLVLTGMHKSGFCLSELYAKRALALFLS